MIACADGAGFAITDLGAKNGTVIDGVAVGKVVDVVRPSIMSDKVRFELGVDWR